MQLTVHRGAPGSKGIQHAHLLPILNFPLVPYYTQQFKSETV